MHADPIPPAQETPEAIAERIVRTAANAAAYAGSNALAYVAEPVITAILAERTTAAAQVSAARATAPFDYEAAFQKPHAIAVADFANEALHAIRALGPAPSTAGAWRPISEAPKDGTDFLACSPASSVFFAHWAGRGVVDSSSYAETTGFLPRYATHWQPLPAPPVTGIPDAQQEGV